MTPARKEALLALVEPLVASLRKLPIYLVEDGGTSSAVARGIPASCLGTVVAFLHRERDLDRLRAFVDRLDQVDPMAAQNQANPQAQYRALGEELGPWLDEHPKLSAEECHYVLAWVRRFLPKDSSPSARPPRPHRSRASRAQAPEPSSAASQPAPLTNNPFAQLRALLDDEDESDS